jgi:hypothetical protein
MELETSSDGWNNADRGRSGDGGVIPLLKVTDILIIEIDIDKVSELARLRVEMALEIGVAFYQVVHHLSNTFAFNLNALLVIGVGPKRGWN